MKRVIVCTDIRGTGEPDDSFSLAHLFCFASKVGLLGFVISRPAGNIKSYNQVAKAFEKDIGLNLPYRVEIGATKKAPSQGWDKPTAGSKFIAAAAASEELIVLCWGSCNDVAQAVHDNPSIVPNLKVFLGGVIGYNYQQDPAPYHYLKTKKNLVSIWTDKAGRGMNVGGQGKYTAKGYVEKVIKPCGKLGKLLASLASHTTTKGLKWGDSQGVLFTMMDGWDNPAKRTWAGKYKQIPGTKHWEDVSNSPAYIQRTKALKQWEDRLAELYGD